MAIKRKPQSVYQHDPLVIPYKWNGEERQFALRLSQLIDQLFARKVPTSGDDTIVPPPSAEEGITQDEVTSLFNKMFAEKKAELLLEAYPVGSLYISEVAGDPSEKFGGTWEQIQDRFLLAAGTSFEAGSTGGEATHILTVDEMPKHDHNVSAGVPYDNLVMMAAAPNLYGAAGNGAGSGDWKWNKGVPAQGGSQPHNNMPPYLAVYVWRRTA